MILVGEVRDVETARIAVQAASTGHFVLSSIHAAEPPFPPCTGCSTWGSRRSWSHPRSRAVRGTAPRAPLRARTDITEYEPTAEELAFLESLGGRPPEEGLLPRARAATSVAQTGYLERIGVYELTPDQRRASAS